MTELANGLPLAAVSATEKAADVETPFQRFLSGYCESKVAIGAFFGFLVVLFLALACPWISPTNPYDLMQVDIMENRLPPGSARYSDGMIYWLGTDGQGRDMLSGIFYGLRTSLFVGAMSGVIALMLGTTVGLTAAYFGGRVDTVIMRIVDLQLSFPTILVALMLLAILGQGVDKIIIALVTVQWAYYARTIRSQALIERRREYIEAAQCLALGHRRIVFRHLLPNCMPPLIVVGTVQVAHAIALEATLSFLGLGLPPTEPSLGLLIANGFDYMLSGRYWISFYPGVALLIAIATINLMGDQLRDVLNPRLQK
ncbi:MAG: ABC transporter permease [Rhodospirillales bacterium]|jgi:peptide/nickel transport system permease protein|nr:ABC transporter permease [Rhodospirillales bacterium]